MTRKDSGQRWKVRDDSERATCGHLEGSIAPLGVQRKVYVRKLKEDLSLTEKKALLGTQSRKHLKKLKKYARQSGNDSSGIVEGMRNEKEQEDGTGNGNPRLSVSVPLPATAPEPICNTPTVAEDLTSEPDVQPGTCQGTLSGPGPFANPPAPSAGVTKVRKHSGGQQTNRQAPNGGVMGPKSSLEERRAPIQSNDKLKEAADNMRKPLLQEQNKFLESCSQEEALVTILMEEIRELARMMQTLKLATCNRFTAATLCPKDEPSTTSTPCPACKPCPACTPLPPVTPRSPTRTPRPYVMAYGKIRHRLRWRPIRFVYETSCLEGRTQDAACTCAKSAKDEFSEYEKHTQGFGSKMLTKWGWVKGTGLGNRGTGILGIVEVVLRPKYRGLGYPSRSQASKLGLHTYSILCNKFRPTEAKVNGQTALPT